MGKYRNDLIARTAMLLFGFVALVVGVSAFDWRIGLVVGGFCLLVAGLYIPYDDEVK